MISHIALLSCGNRQEKAFFWSVSPRGGRGRVTITGLTESIYENVDAFFSKTKVINHKSRGEGGGTNLVKLTEKINFSDERPLTNL